MKYFPDYISNNGISKCSFIAHGFFDIPFLLQIIFYSPKLSSSDEFMTYLQSVTGNIVPEEKLPPSSLIHSINTY
jgi:hypothetical protein